MAKKVYLNLMLIEDIEAEWKLFWRHIFAHYKGSSIYQVLLGHGDIVAAFPNLLSVVSVARNLSRQGFEIEWGKYSRKYHAHQH